MAPFFKNISQLYEYEDNQRSSVHILWCWTLFLVRHVFSFCITLPGFFSGALHFLNTYEARLLKVLRFQGYRDASNTPIRYTMAVSLYRVMR
jgi:hypothetical protein